MSEQPISAEEVNVRSHVYRIMDKHLSAAFEELDHLHKRNIHDDAVIKALRDGGYKSEADAYIEWAGAIDPDVDPTLQGEELVTDPADAPSYDQHPLNEAEPFDVGWFRAEPSVVAGWNVYKRRGSMDNGAFLGQFPDRATAHSVMEALSKGKQS